MSKEKLGTIRLARGEVGFFDPLTNIHLNLSSPMVDIFKGMDVTNIRRSVQSGRLLLVAGSLEPAAKSIKKETLQVKEPTKKEETKKQEPVEESKPETKEEEIKEVPKEQEKEEKPKAKEEVAKKESAEDKSDAKSEEKAETKKTTRRTAAKRATKKED